MSVPTFEKGNTIQLKLTFTDNDGKLVAPDNEEAFIEIIKISNDEVMVSDTTMTKLSDTQYQFNWDTTEGMGTGEYEVEVDAEISGDDVLDRDRIKLVDIIYDDKAGC